MLKDADDNGSAVPAFNYSDIWELLAIVEAAKEEKSPVIIASNSKVSKTLGLRLLGSLGKEIMEDSEIPVVNHLDHSTNPEMCMEAIDCDYLSVMIDASKFDLEKNIEITKSVVEYAKGKNVCVEGEVGRIKGNNEEGTSCDQDYLVKVEDAVRIAEESGIDSLAVGIGNVHGFYKNPVLDFNRLAEVNAAVKIPLVLHGGTGIPDEDIKEAIKNGINKVNIGTHLHYTYLEKLKEILDKDSDIKNMTIVDTMNQVKEAVKVPVRRWIKICGANGKA
jgi:ketose-bisphosphate aldolase